MNTNQTPSQAQVDAGIARGRRLQSAAFADFFEAIAAMFTSGSDVPQQTVYGNGAR